MDLSQHRRIPARRGAPSGHPRYLMSKRHRPGNKADALMLAFAEAPAKVKVWT